jgi:hypothetical protein
LPPDFSGTIRIPDNLRLGTFRETRSQKALIELVSDSRGITFGLHVLSLAGLAEAFVYLKRFDELSAGQKYRAALAMLLASSANVWVADEFCVNLDAVTASVVSHNLQKIARQTKATVIVAAPDCSNFITSLAPDRVLLLRSSTEHVLMSGSDYLSLMCSRVRRVFSAPRISVPAWTRKAIGDDGTTCVVTQCNDVKEGSIVLLVDPKGEIPARVCSMERKVCSHLGQADVDATGFASLSELRKALKRSADFSQEAIAFVVRVRALSTPLLS